MNGGELGIEWDSPRQMIYANTPRSHERRLGFGPRGRQMGAAILAAADITIASLGIKTVADHYEFKSEDVLACAADYCVPETEITEEQRPQNLTEESLPVAEPPTPATSITPSPDVSIAASQKATLPVDVNVFREYRMPVDVETARQIEAVRLTPEGYQNFFANLDLSWFDYTQGHNDFNPNKVAIRQGRTEWVTAHFTAGYFNEAGWSVTHPEGSFSPKRMVDSMARREGPCCAVNFAIDRTGRVYQFAPFNAKLRHNPPYDEKTTGWEIESHAQSAMKTIQYESAMYLTIAMLVNEGLLGNGPLSSVLKGHGEDRDMYREANPHSKKWGQRNDFDEPLMHITRFKIEEFLKTYPEAANLTQKLR